MDSYQKIMKQIAQLEVEANKVRKRNISKVVLSIKQEMKKHGITAEDLGLKTTREQSRSRQTEVPRISKPKKPVAIKYRDQLGNTWTGRGKQPRWLSNAIASGQAKEMFLIKDSQ